MNISHEKIFTGKISDFSSELGGESSVHNLVKEEGVWTTGKNDDNEMEFFVLDLRTVKLIDFIELVPSGKDASAFPRGFRIELSINGEFWKVIHTEKNFSLEGESYTLDIPLNRMRYLRLLITDHHKNDSKYFSEIARCNVGISGIREITSSSISGDNRPEKLIDNDMDTFWESEEKPSASREYLSIDLGKVEHINRIILTSADSGFPEDFYLDTSTDKNVWIRLFEEKGFKSEKSRKYFWDFNITPARYIRIETDSVKNGSDKFSVKIAEIRIFSAVPNPSHTHNVGDLVPYASIFQAGIVRLAKDGDDSSAAVVQGSDRRLRCATTVFKGIVQLAGDGDETEGVVVQASDGRLKEASDEKPGIVRLAYDRENKPGTAVQGNDSRLEEATEENFGIVKLCPDGDESGYGVVRGNDRRLKNAGESDYGICRLARDGENKPGSVVQGNDRRLRDATTNFTGIVKLAEDGEENPGTAVQGNDRRLKDATTSSKGIVELAEDGEDTPGTVVQGSDRRLKDATTGSKGIIELAENGEVKPGVAVQSDDSRLRDATTGSKGIVELAEDGEDTPGTVVQGNDRRLKDATEVSTGIMRFAHDGGDEPFTAVQGNDKRLKDATTTFKGIVELAEDGETDEGVAVQGNDSRLKNATTETKGIVELAENGEVKPGVAVQGDDHRLRDAGEKTKGIIRFASNGESSQLAAVQGNDKRLKDATTTSKGIVELAEDGEVSEGVAVQGNDKRLRDATTTYRGIVELAEDGEDNEGVAVQGSDKRLKKASTESYGIVKFAQNGEKVKKAAVQADDERLSDPREPLPHDHNYASLDHDFNSHSGTLSIKGSVSEPFGDIVPPPENSTIIQGVNESDQDGSIGISGVAGVSAGNEIQAYGVAGYSRHIGVRGESPGGEKLKGCGVLGISRFGAGGVFASEHSFSVVADGYGKIGDYEKNLNLMGNGDALLVNGKTVINGEIFLNNRENKFSSGSIVEMFEIDDEEFISSGDLLVVSEAGNSVLSHSRSEYDSRVIGVVAGNPALIINNTGKEEKLYPVALTGKVMCKVDARNRPVAPGDLIVTSNTPGCGMAGDIDSFNKVGSVIGKALDGLSEGIGVIPLFISMK
jgi:hypothetical protein